MFLVFWVLSHGLVLSTRYGFGVPASLVAFGFSVMVLLLLGPISVFVR